MPTHVTLHSKKTKKPLSTPHRLTTLDTIVMVVSVLYPLSALPQVVTVFSGYTEGVSILSWIVFMLCAGLFLLYGVKRRVMPMIISNSIWLVMDGLVIAGIFIHSSTPLIS